MIILDLDYDDSSTFVKKFSKILAGYVAFGIKKRGMAISQKWTDWNHDRSVWSVNKAKADTRWIQDPTDAYSIEDHEFWEIEPLSQVHRQSNEKLINEMIEEYKSLFPEPRKWEFEFIFEKNAKDYPLQTLIRDFYIAEWSDALTRRYSPKVRELSSHILFDTPVHRYVFLPINTRKTPLLRRR